MTTTGFSRSTDPGAQTLTGVVNDVENIAPHMGFSGVYSPTIASLQHMPPPPSATPPTFILGPLARSEDHPYQYGGPNRVGQTADAAASAANGKVQGVMGLTQPILSTATRRGQSGADRIQRQAMLYVGQVRALLGR